MNRNKLLAMLCLVSAIILGLSSVSFTAKLFMSIDNTNFKYVLLLVAIVIDFGKFAFSALSAFQYQKEKYISCIIYALLAIFCVITSFLASMSYDLNQANEISNETVTSSGTYKRQTELFDLTTGIVASTKKDVEQMKASRSSDENKIREDYKQRIYNAKRMNYITTKKIGVNDLTAEMDMKIRELDSKIAEKESILNSKQSELTNVNDGFATVKGSIKTTKGINSLATWISPENEDSAIGTINFVKNILIEICAIAFSIGFGVLVKKKDEKEEVVIEKIEEKNTHQDEEKPEKKKSYLMSKISKMKIAK